MHICKEFKFDASHTLQGLPAGHKCLRLHGHTYTVVLFVTGILDSIGMIADYAEIEEVWRPLHELLDHRHLNDVPGLDNPTTENLAWWIFKRIHEVPINSRRVTNDHFDGVLAATVTRVRVYESSSTYCEVP